MAFEIREEEIRKAITVFHPDGRIFEVRIIDGKQNAAGVFSSADGLLAALARISPPSGANIYMTLNRLDPACYARKHRDRFMERITPTVSDNDVIGYDWLMVDIDPRRKAGVSSTKAELEGSRKTARQIRQYLKDRSWPDPVVAHSGNGTHLLYSIAVGTEQKPLIEKCLKALNMLFADDAQDVDVTTFNPSRICKLYGTMARKGAGTEDRPHRWSRILDVPERLEAVPPALLQALADELPVTDTPQPYNGYNPGGFDLQAWITEHRVPVKEKTTWAHGTKWILDACPFNPQHTGKDAALLQVTGGGIKYKCFHASCQGNGWREFRLLYEPDAYQPKNVPPVIPNYMLSKPDSFGKVQLPEYKTDTPDGPVWRTTEEIRARVIPDEAHILTGIQGIDRRMIGLKKGYVTVLSGLRSAGKSSILSQLVIQCRQQGLRCALFSGEMIDKQVLKWLTLQAAGKNHVHGTQYEKVFYPDDDAAEMVSRWLDGYVYVYNNDWGNRFTDLEQHLINIITEKQLDLVLLDNLMAMNVEDLDRDLYVRQTKFVKELKRMAQGLNVHVLFVAHPRKAGGYLRMDDISGSGDLSNAADNVFIIHRVDEDYKKLTQQYFQWSASNELYQADNVIEICKDRDLGNRDVNVPLYFEKETKRLRNNPAEYIHYGWEQELPDTPDGFTVVEDEDVPW